MIRKLFRRFKKNEHGASMVEFALIAPILFLFILGIIEFGWIFNGYITLTGSAREGARLAVVGKDDDEIRTAVKNHATAFDPDELIIVIDPPTEQGNERKVTVTGDVELLTGLFDGVTLSAKATMRQEVGTIASNGGGNPPDNGDDNGDGDTGPTECTGPPCNKNHPCDYCSSNP